MSSAFDRIESLLKKCLFTICIFILILSVGVIIPKYNRLVYALQTQEIKGHLQPLGFHQPPNENIDTLEEFPHPQDFYKKYVKGSRPVLFKGLAKSMPAFSLWTDDYLRDQFGKFPVSVETGKKENRGNPMLQMNMKEFLGRYAKDDIYMVHDLLSHEYTNKEMLSDLVMPRCLQCGNFEKVLNNIIMWFSSGGTNSVLHTDSLDNINCIMSGTKQFFMVDKKHGIHEKFDKAGSHSGVNVEKVDMIKYPELQNLPWYNVTMETGDCLFIPYLWGHNVKSSNNRNLAINFWISHLGFFNHSDCEENKLDDNASIRELEAGEMPFLFMQHLISGIEEEFGGAVPKNRFKDVILHLMESYDIEPRIKIDINQVFAKLDLNSDKVLTKEEVLKTDSNIFAPLIDPEMFESGYSKDEL